MRKGREERVDSVERGKQTSTENTARKPSKAATFFCPHFSAELEKPVVGGGDIIGQPTFQPAATDRTSRRTNSGFQEKAGKQIKKKTLQLFLLFVKLIGCFFGVSSLKQKQTVMKKRISVSLLSLELID